MALSARVSFRMVPAVCRGRTKVEEFVLAELSEFPSLSDENTGYGATAFARPGQATERQYCCL